jgi:hypothetical protein
MQDVAAVVGKDLFTDELRETLGQFEQAKNFGSLIVPKLRDPAETLRVVEAKNFDNWVQKDVQARLLKVLRMAEALSPKYHVVVANPPYAADKGLNKRIKAFAEGLYPSSKSNLYSMFMERILALGVKNSFLGLMTPFSWMYISNYEKLRNILLRKADFVTLTQLDYDAYTDAKAHPCAFTLTNAPKEKRSGVFIRLEGFKGASLQPTKCLEAISDKDCKWRFSRSNGFFDKIPGKQIAFSLNPRLMESFETQPKVSDIGEPKGGLSTTDNDRFLRFWPEVSISHIGFGVTDVIETKEVSAIWFPIAKGGLFRKWAGNHEHVVNWRADGEDIKAATKGAAGGRIVSPEFYFKEGVTWSGISSAIPSMRRMKNFIFGSGGKGLFAGNKNDSLLGFLNSKVATTALQILSPTVNIESSHIGNLPVRLFDEQRDIEVHSRLVSRLVETARRDWDAYETSWDFTTLPLLSPGHRGETLADSYATLRTHWQSMTEEMKALEEENNRIFIDAYGLQDDLQPDVPFKEITLTCNPAYRYGVKGTEEDRETRLRADTMAEFLSYAVGCMFGRYSLDAPGLILANQGERLEDYLARVPEPTFRPDADNVIPVLDGDWFPDDITERFRLFLRVTFGEAHFRENLRYVEEALGKDIRKYFTKDFYADHVKRYKKRPIYWMFSSPKGTFNALIYMHRYRPDTVSVLLNDYLREFITKLEGERERLEKLSDDESATQAQRTKALKDAAKVATQIEELTAWERDVVFPLAQQKIEIDLDDGVKANYPKFGSALKKITGLS